jgi:hypothetical protein
MKNKTWGIVFVVLGSLMVVFDFLVEPLGIGAGGFGWKQIFFLAAGIAALGAGLFFTFTKAKK